MDILELVKTAVAALMKDNDLLSKFNIDPFTVIKTIIGSNYADDIIGKVVEGVKAQLANAEGLSNLAGNAADAVTDKLGDAAKTAASEKDGIASKAVDALKGLFKK